VTDPTNCPKPSSGVPTSGVIARGPGPTSIDFRDIFEQHLDYVLRTLRCLGVGSADLEDVAHDVFLHLYRHLGDYDPARPLKPWLYAFIYRAARDFRLLARHRETVSDDVGQYIDAGPRPDALVMRQQLQQLALRGLEALEPEERGVLVATTLDELTAPEIAEAMNIPLNTVYSRLRRARAKFEAAVDRLRAQARYA
jgi:RNA polymerase sigma-70 factor (ECF subfamily)